MYCFSPAEGLVSTVGEYLQYSTEAGVCIYSRKVLLPVPEPSAFGGGTTYLASLRLGSQFLGVLGLG